jgi:hypothetical protein
MAEGAANLTIGQVAEQTGPSVHALRYYEREASSPNPSGAVATGIVSTARTTWSG